MISLKPNRRVYSAEQLHRLRETVSQPKLHEAIEEQYGEDADLVKEHVLRGSKSFTARSWRSRTSANSFRFASNDKENRSTGASEGMADSSAFLTAPKTTDTSAVLDEIAPNNQMLRPGPRRLRPSPTASLKRQKVEAIVKAHGSPQHVRVTAGGRIVPSEQSPLCHPRYGYSAVNVNGGLVKFAPNHPIGKAQWTQATQNGFVAQDINGQLCQIVNGTILPLNEIDGALQLYMPAPNLNIATRTTSTNAASTMFDRNAGQSQPTQGPTAPQPSLASQIKGLELEYEKLEHELKDVDKAEVLHGRTMGKVAKETLIEKRRDLVTTLDRIRKTVKGLKEHVAAGKQAEPRLGFDRPPTSPRGSRLPNFLQKPAHDASLIPYGPYVPPYYTAAYPGVPQPVFAPMYGMPPQSLPDCLLGGQAWPVPPPAMFDQHRVFDNPLSTMSMPIPEPFDPAMAVGAQVREATSTLMQQDEDEQAHLPQHDGTRSTGDLHKIHTRSHALPITKPQKGSLTDAKSMLNPMSPAYKPSSGLRYQQPAVESPDSPKERYEASRSPIPVLRASVEHNRRPAGMTDDTISPTKKSPHLHSSSVSSFETADFFPRNTREFSTRNYTYKAAANGLDDQQNTSSTRPSVQPPDCVPLGDGGNSRRNHDQREPLQSMGSSGPPTVPPGTPANGQAAPQAELPYFDSPRHVCGYDNTIRSIPDREVHSVSPKVKRGVLQFIHETPATFRHGSPSSELAHACQDELCVTSSPYGAHDFAQKSRQWLEGYQAGLNRNVVGADRAGDFLNGYCAGLLKSKPVERESPSTEQQLRRDESRRSPRSSANAIGAPTQNDGPLAPVRPRLQPFEKHLKSMDTLKQAVFAPQNENAILTPAVDGPHVSEPPFNLGAWAQERGQNSGTTSTAHQHPPNAADPPFAVYGDKPGVSRETYQAGNIQPPSDIHSHQLAASKHQSFNHELPPLPSSPAPSGDDWPLRNAPSGYGDKTRISSLTGMESNMFRQLPSHRVLSAPLDWKSASSVSPHVGIANGFFAQAQFDGTLDRTSSESLWGQALTHGHPRIGTQPLHNQNPAVTPRVTSLGVEYYPGRFREGSLDGITNPPTSPYAASPPVSPRVSPHKERLGQESPLKGSSPARAKFEHIAEKVGIKAASAPKDRETGEPRTPPGKRRWRDVWRGASRKEGE